MSSKKSKAKHKLTNAKHPSPTTGTKQKTVANNASRATIAASGSKKDDLPSAGYLVSCDIPTKQFIQYLNELKPVDKKFILHDLDSTHLLIKLQARTEIERKVEEWLDENIFSAIEKVGEDLDMS